MITDSWEAGPQNWTDDMIAEFTKRRGYDPRPWMPVLAGRVVESAEASDRFLWDFRRTISDLVAENHYDEIGQLLHERGMGRYERIARIRPRVHRRRHGGQAQADVPMSAMWTQMPGV